MSAATGRESGVETRSNQVNVFDHIKTFSYVYPFHYQQGRRILLKYTLISVF
jgi:hypothetical protein